jgi:pyrroline-5-carboxylate reductase
MTYGIVGVGALAEAIVTGLGDEAVVLSPRNAGRSAALAARHPSVRVAADNQAVLDAAEVVLLCVRPQDAAEVLEPLAFATGHVVISAMAGIDVATLRRLVAPAGTVTRVIPLPSVARRGALTPVHPPEPHAKALFDRLGEAVELDDEARFEAFSASTATIASHFAYLDAITRWLAAQGVGAEAATRYVSAAFADLAAVLETGAPFPQLARDHATPGGINELFLDTLAAAGVFDEVPAGLDRVLARLTDRR